MLIWWAGLWPNRDVVGMHFEFLSRYNIFLFKSDNRICDCRSARRKFSSLGGELLVKQIRQVHFMSRHIPNSSSINGKSGTCKTRNQSALSQHLPFQFWTDENLSLDTKILFDINYLRCSLKFQFHHSILCFTKLNGRNFAEFDVSHSPPPHSCRAQHFCSKTSVGVKNDHILCTCPYSRLQFEVP